MAGNRVIQCVGPSYMLVDRKSAVQRAIGLYMRQVEGLGEDRQVVLDSAPGLTLFADLGASTRGAYCTGTRYFVVAGATLYEMLGGVGVSRGTLSTGSGYVSMKHGRDQLILVDGSDGYALTLATNVFAQITDPDFRGSQWVEELNGTFIFIDPYFGKDQFYISAIDDGTNFDALDFSSADAQPDDLVTHRVLKQELFLFGQFSTEVWVYTGDTLFPLTRYNSTPIDVGVVGFRAAINAADTLYFVGQTRTGSGLVYQMRGHQPVRISTQAVEESLKTSSDLSAVTMWTYQTKGNEFIGINAPGMNTTLVYDASTQQWHERSELLEGAYIARRDDLVTLFAGTHYACAGTKVYALDDQTYDLDGDPLVRERTWPHLVSPSAEMTTFAGLELACTTGNGGNITLEISNDGGFNFGPPLQRSLGATGQWMQRVRWLMLGSAFDRVFRLRCTDAVPLTIHGANVQAS